jgi:cytochrome c-type biogenesis protein
MDGPFAIGVALLAGLVSFLSPCVLPLVPAYVAYLGGQAGGTGAAFAADRRLMVAAARPRAVLSGLAFVAGLSAVFIAAFYVLGTVLAPVRPFIATVAGVVVILMALQVAGLLTVPALNREFRLVDRFPGEAGPGGALLLGMGMAAGWTPCVGATLAAVLNTAARDGVTAMGLAQMLAYCVGLGIPFLAMALAIERAVPLVRALGRHRRAIDLASAAVLATMGVLLLTDNLLWITNLGARVLPAVPFGL